MVGDSIFRDSKITAVFIILILGISGFIGALVGLSFLGSSTNGTPSISPPTYVESGSLLPRPFAEYYDYENQINFSAPQYELKENLSNVMNLDKYVGDPYWTPEVQEQIQEHYFAAIPDTINQFYEVYGSNSLEAYPSFVTADSLLHAYHVIYDTVLQRCEENNFTSDIMDLTNHMIEVTEAQSELLSTSRWQQAALKNLAFFSVAMKILDEEWSAPSSVFILVEEVLNLMVKAEGFKTSWFMGQKEDFSQYTPRGHYTRSEALKKYFKVMMWFGRIGFRLYPHDDWILQEANEERGRNETAQAILLTVALMDSSSVFPESGMANQTWTNIYDTSSFFVGVSDDLTPFEYMKMIESIYGRNPAVGILENETALQTFRNKTSTCRNPEILSSYLMDTGDASINTKGLRFMGQRFVPDSYILGQLVYKNVGLDRTMPKGLDVMASFGSARAWELLEDDKGVLNYVNQSIMLQDRYGNLTATTWTQNLYWLWLYSFTPLLQGIEEGQPSFMLDPAWTDKQLLTSLGTWTELRHDTILYAKQSYTYDTFGSPPTPPPGYVEPVPALYARLSSLCKMMIDGLGSRYVLDFEARNKLMTLYNTLRSMQAISEKELQGIPLNETECEKMKHVGSILSSLEGFGTAGGRAELVVDVNTDTPNGEVLQEATGKPMMILVAVPDENGVPFLARGAMYSYYEFIQPMSQRLTDEEWWSIINTDSTPPMPDWVSSFVIETNDLPFSYNVLSENSQEFQSNRSISYLATIEVIWNKFRFS
ncbi:MAG: DUF3160 domain-containing protein [Candidatus Thorarchaeota archaeon]|nr:DUF3160 domain-containing protein [Candidatus Thorarchaeota archaeon]